jgi:hypothetical protein
VSQKSSILTYLQHIDISSLRKKEVLVASLISEPEGRHRQILMKSEPTLRAHGQPATLPVDAWNERNLRSLAWQCGKGSSIRARSIRPDRMVAFMIKTQNILGRPRETQVRTKTMVSGRQEVQSRGNSTPRRSSVPNVASSQSGDVFE